MERERPPVSGWASNLHGERVADDPRRLGSRLGSADRAERAFGLREVEPIVACDEPERQVVALGPALGVYPHPVLPVVRGSMPERDVGRAERFEQRQQLLGGLERTMELVDP